MSDWREKATPEYPNVPLSCLGDGEQMVVTFLDDGHLEQTNPAPGETQEALVVGVEIEEVPDGAEDMNGDEITEGNEYQIMSSSSRFQYQLSEFADDLAGSSAVINAEGASDSFTRQYYVEAT